MPSADTDRRQETRSDRDRREKRRSTSRSGERSRRKRPSTGGDRDRSNDRRERERPPRRRSVSRDRGRRRRSTDSERPVLKPRYHKSPSPEDDPTRPRRIHVGGLSDQITKPDLEVTFNQFGPILDMWLAETPPYYAFIRFVNPESAGDAVLGMRKTTLKNCKPKVSMALPRRKNGEPKPVRPPGGYGPVPAAVVAAMEGKPIPGLPMVNTNSATNDRRGGSNTQRSFVGGGSGSGTGEGTTVPGDPSDPSSRDAGYENMNVSEQANIRKYGAPGYRSPIRRNGKMATPSPEHRDRRAPSTTSSSGDSSSSHSSSESASNSD